MRVESNIRLGSQREMGTATTIVCVYTKFVECSDVSENTGMGGHKDECHGVA